MFSGGQIGGRPCDCCHNRVQDAKPKGPYKALKGPNKALLKGALYGFKGALYGIRVEFQV